MMGIPIAKNSPMTINMSLRDDPIHPCQFLPCTELDLTMISEAALKLLNEIQEK